MKKYFLTIIILLLSCAPTEPVETHDDNAILQLLLNIAEPSLLLTLINEFDNGVDNSGIKIGLVGEIGISKDFTKEEEKVLRGAAIASRET